MENEKKTNTVLEELIELRRQLREAKNDVILDAQATQHIERALSRTITTVENMRRLCRDLEGWGGGEGAAGARIGGLVRQLYEANT